MEYIMFGILILVIAALVIIDFGRYKQKKIMLEYFAKIDKRTDELVKINLDLISQAKEIFERMVDDEECEYDKSLCQTHYSENPCSMSQIREWLHVFEARKED